MIEFNYRTAITNKNQLKSRREIFYAYQKRQLEKLSPKGVKAKKRPANTRNLKKEILKMERQERTIRIIGLVLTIVIMSIGLWLLFQWISTDSF